MKLNLRRLRSAALAVTLSFTACAPPQMMPDEPIEEELQAASISQEIGPEGGELIGGAGTEFEGVRLQIPAGALASKTSISISTTVDDVPLTGLAERVGPQFLISPAGTTFAIPAQLTVPLVPEDVQMHDQSPEDCKVWHRNGEAWARLERIGGDAKSVTVELSATGSAAAGVLGRTLLTCRLKPALCRSGLVTVLEPTNDCTDPSGYCLVRLRKPTFAASQHQRNYAVVGHQLYYVHVPARNQVAVIRYDLTTGASVKLGQISVTSSVISDTPIAVEADGSAWLGLGGSGNAKFKENAPAFRFDSGPDKDGYGVVVNGTQVLRFYEDDNDMKMTDGSATVRPVPPDYIHHYQLLKRPAVPGKIIGFSGVPYDISFDMTVERSLNPVVHGGLAAAASMVNAGFAVATSDHDIVWTTAANGTQRLPLDMRMVAFDRDDLLYSAIGNTPEVNIVTAQGGIAVYPLTTAASNDPEYSRVKPVAMVGVPSHKEVVLVMNGIDQVREFYLLKKSN